MEFREITPMRPHILPALLLAISFAVAAQTSPYPPRFKGHAIGETSQQFFAIAQHRCDFSCPSLSGWELTTDWCSAIDQREKDLESEQAHARKQRDRDRLVRQLTEHYVFVDACQPVKDALAGKDATALAIIASELGPGGQAIFHNGVLVEVALQNVDTYDHVVADMTKKLGESSGQQMISYENGLGATFQYPRSDWSAGTLSASVEQHPGNSAVPSWIAVTIWDQGWASGAAKNAEKERKSSLD